MTANNLVLKIIFGIVIVSLILTDVSNCLVGGGNDYTAKVNDQEINRRQFENAFNSERSYMQQQLGDQCSELAVNEGYMKTLRQQVLNRLIDEAPLDQCARELKLGISDEQAKQAIFATPTFQVDGKFDNSRYNGILDQMGMTTDQYTQALRNQFTTQQLISGVTSTDFTLKGETDELAALIVRQRVMREATTDVNALAAKQPVAGQEIVSYYEQNGSNFMTSEQFHMSYIKLGVAAMQQPVSDVDIRSYYDQYQNQFTQPRRTRYSIIQTKTEGEVKAILDELNKGSDFAALAKEEPADIISAHDGGGTGWLEDATIPDELKNADLKEKGQLPGVIKSSVNFLIACLDDIQSVRVKSLGEVRDDIAAKVRHEKALDTYYALQQKVSDAVGNDAESLAGVEQATGVKAIRTGWFSKDSLPEELNFRPVADAIFNDGLVGENGVPGVSSDIIIVDGGRAFMLRISEHKSEAMKSLIDVQEQVKALTQHNKTQQQARVDAEKLLADLKAGEGTEAMQAAGLKFGEPKTLSRSGCDSISQTASASPLPAKDKPSCGMAIGMQGNVVLLVLDEVRQSSMSEDQKRTMVQGITRNNTQIVFEVLMGNLREEAKIKIGDVLEQQ